MSNVKLQCVFKLILFILKNVNLENFKLHKNTYIKKYFLQFHYFRLTTVNIFMYFLLVFFLTHVYEYLYVCIKHVFLLVSFSLYTFVHYPSHLIIYQVKTFSWKYKLARSSWKTILPVCQEL